MFLVLAIFILVHDTQRPDLDAWYSGLKRPGVTMSTNFCCSKTDCHTTEAQIRETEWWARLGHHKGDGWELTEWVRIPKLSIISGHDNPTGEAVICHDNVGTIDAAGHQYHPNPEAVIVFCFVPPNES